MKVEHGTSNPSGFGTGVYITLSGDELATAIDAYLVAHGICVSGPRTVTVNGMLCKDGRVFVDPSGFVIHEGERLDGRGPDYGEWSCADCGDSGLGFHACPGCPGENQF